MTKTNQNKTWTSIAFGILFLATILLWFKSQYIITILTKLENSDYQRRGAYGDSFGMITSLFSSLTFFLVLYGIYYQRKEMSTQNEMLNLSKRQHYFDRAYAYLEKNITKLKDQETYFLQAYKDLDGRRVMSNWNTLRTEDLNNTDQEHLETNTNIINAIKSLKNFTENKVPPFTIILKDIDRLIKKLLGDAEYNRDDYECLKEVIKLQLDKDLKEYIDTTLKFYTTYKNSDLFQNAKIIKYIKGQSYNHKVDSNSKYTNLETLNGLKNLYL
ncbi:MAG: hypothetical protein IPQ02_09555 [Saprospiraceae bacterium]|nr:hypothetical protein [Candidatus Defluviibacterium haderslevense]